MSGDEREAEDTQEETSEKEDSSGVGVNILTSFTETFQKFKKSYLSKNAADSKQPQNIQKKIPTLENWTTIMKEKKLKMESEVQETGFNNNQIDRLYSRFSSLDKQDKGYLSREDFLRIPELAISPLGDRIVHAFFTESRCGDDEDEVDESNERSAPPVNATHKIHGTMHIQNSGPPQQKHRGFGACSTRAVRRGVVPTAQSVSRRKIPRLWSAPSLKISGVGRLLRA